MTDAARQPAAVPRPHRVPRHRGHRDRRRGAAERRDRHHLARRRRTSSPTSRLTTTFPCPSRTSSPRPTTSSSTCPRTTPSPTSVCAARCRWPSTARSSSTPCSGGILEPANGLFSPGQEGYLEDNGLADRAGPRGAAALIEEYEAETGQRRRRSSLGHTADAGSTTRRPSCSSAGGTEIGVDASDQQVPQDQFITNALFGDPTFYATCWRNHAGVGVDEQYFWWHSAGLAPDGELSLNFGRVDDPDVDDGPRRGRASQATRRQHGRCRGRQPAFGRECYQIPLSWTLWGTLARPAIQGLGDLVAARRHARPATAPASPVSSGCRPCSSTRADPLTGRRRAHVRRPAGTARPKRGHPCATSCKARPVPDRVLPRHVRRDGPDASRAERPGRPGPDAARRHRDARS